MKYAYLIFTFLIVTASCKKIDDNPITPSSQQEFDNYLDEQVASQNIVAMSVLLFKGDVITYEKYLGVKDKSNSEPLNKDHIFLLASVSKTVTATALMQLHEKGKFQLDDKVNGYLPFSVKVPGKSTDITFRMLLTHTSGIADGSALDNEYYDNQDSPTPLAAFLQDYLTPAGKHYDANDNFHDFEPGTKHEYSNVGSALIGFLVEQISGMPFDEYCQQNIFTPLGMNNTYWKLSKAPSDKLVRGYDNNKSIEHYTFTDYPNGALRSTVQDMFKFISAYSTNGSYKGIKLLEPGTINTMLSSQIPAIDGTVGLHWFVMDSNNNIWGHDGGEKGVATIMGVNTSNDVGALIFTNQGEADLESMLVSAYNYAVKL